ncbi:MAG: hypothetical protein R3C28_28475 [Pirellulaceae bacterium]
MNADASLSMPLLTTIESSVLTLADGGNVEVPILENINRASILVGSGVPLTLPLITSYVQDVRNTTRTLRASGIGSELNLPNLRNINVSGGVGRGFNEASILQIEALNGGVVGLSRVGQIEDTSGDYDGTLIKSEGQGSLVDLSSLVNFIDNDGGSFPSFMTANDRGQIRTPNLATLREVNVTTDGIGTIALSNVHTWNNSILTVSSIDFSLPNLTTFQAGRITVNADASLSMPLLTTIESSVLTLADGGNVEVPILENINRASILVGSGVPLTLPLITSYVQDVRNTTRTLRASGIGSELNLPNLRNINVSGGVGRGFNEASILQIEALNGGVVGSKPRGTN